MATIQRLHRKTSNGYEVIHLETELAAIEDYSSGGSGAWNGSVSLGADVTWCGLIWTVVHIGYYGGDCSATVGGTGNWMALALKTITNTTQQWSSSMTTYANSALKTAMANFESTISSHADFSQAIDTNIYGVTSKIFAATAGQLSTDGGGNPYSGNDGRSNNGASSGTYGDGTTNLNYIARTTFSLFAGLANGTGGYTGARIACNSSGSTQTYWLATPCISGRAWGVGTYGNLGDGNSTSGRGLRPFVRLAL